jgi:SAM-dependent methyltransferase
MSGNDNKRCEEFCGNCDDGRYIGKDFSAEDYNDYLQIPEYIQTEIADNLIDQLEIERHKGTAIEIFTAGVGPGRIEILFLKKCLDRGISLNLTAVDLDARMLRVFYDNIEKEFKDDIIKKDKPVYAKGISKADGINHFSLNINNNIKIVAFCGNLENLQKKDYYERNHYDHIFSIFVLHAITNWEEPLYHLLRMLKPEGKIVFAEEIGDVNWLDNHFDDIEKHLDICHYNKRPLKGIVESHRDFWKEYHRARKDILGKEWAKDTKASDLGVIDTCLRKMEDFGLVKDCSTDKNIYRWKAEHLFTFKKLLKWIKGEKPLYTPLSYGLGNPGNNKDIGDQDVLANHMECWLKKNSDISLDNEISRIEGHKFHIYTKIFKADKEEIVHKILYGNTVCLHRLRDRIAFETHNIPGNYKGELPPYELTHRLFALRDMYLRLFPFTHSIYMKWKLEDPTDPSKGKLDEDNMPVLLTFPKFHSQNNGQELLNQIKEYIAKYVLYVFLVGDRETIKDFSFAEFVFRDMPEKFPIIIKREDGIEETSIRFSQVSSGMVKSLKICVPEKHIEKFITSIKFTYRSKEISFNDSVKQILNDDNNGLDDFIKKMKFHVSHNKQDNRLNYLNFASSFGHDFLLLSKGIERLGFKINIDSLKEGFNKSFSREIEKIKNCFTDVDKYNNWPEEIPFDRFLFTAFRTAAIGYGTEFGNWDIFAKYPGKCFVHNSKDGKVREEAIGGFIVMRKKLDVGDEDKNNKLESIFEKSHESMLFLISGLWSRNDAILEWGRLMRKQGTKAAVAAIMGRNMSHNIGSHVLSNITITKDDNRDSLSRFYAYLQGRMDFIARIATEWPSCATPMDFYIDVIKVFKEQDILLDNILKSENLNRKEIEFIVTILKEEVHEEVRLRNSNEPCPSCCENICNDVYKYKCALKMTHQITRHNLVNIDVNIPESSIGLQAFYSIMENLIRNSAKHGNKDVMSSEGLKLYIALDKDDSPDSRDLYRVSIWDNVSIIDNAKVDEMNERIKGKLVKESGEIDEKNWGIKEIKISAAFLRRKDINEVEDKPENFIKAIGKDINGKKYLGYEFYLEKPKIMMMIDENDIRGNEKECENRGIYFSKNLEEQVKLGISHQFLFVSLSNNYKETIEIIEDHIIKRDTLPYRLFGLTESDNNNIMIPDNLKGRIYKVPKRDIYEYFDTVSHDSNTCQNAIENTYETWIKKISEDQTSKYFIIIYFEEDESNQVVREWQNIANRVNEKDNSLIHLIILCKNDKEEKIKGISPDKTIMFLRHRGTGLDSALKNEIDDVKKSCLYYEQIEKTSPIFDILWNTYDNGDVYMFLLKLIECSLLRILVIDERVAQKTFAEKDEIGRIRGNEQFQASEILALMGIETITHVELHVDTKQHRLTLSADADKAIKKEGHDFCGYQKLRCVIFKKDESIEVQKYKAGNDTDNIDIINKFHIVVIHQGVLDKLDSKDNSFFISTHWGNTEKFIAELKQYIPFVIIDSGRGKPANLPKNSKYIEYSVIQDWILRKRSKFHIVNALMSLTGKGAN